MAIWSAALRADDYTAEELSKLSIDQLTDLEVTSPSKKTENIADVASAIYVLTEEDIRRSGATSIPEVLRLVPGLDVARIDNSQYAISARGFNALFGDKLLVLMDGRTIYTPLFGGVFWNEHDTVLEDIDRIEVIRGPGATLYGANATNGVINIITKSASKTQGVLVSGGGGNQERDFGEARYGGESGDVSYRAYAKYFYRDTNHLEGDSAAHDAWEGARTGFRTDTQVSDDDLITVQGDFYYGESGWDLSVPVFGPPYRATQIENRYINGNNVLGRWTRTFSDSSNLQFQFYYDRIQRDDELLVQHRDTLDFDFQHRFSPLARNDLIYGLGYRFYQDGMRNSDIVAVEPTSRDMDLFTGFVQDEVTLITDRLRLIVGSKFEHNDLSGWEVMPNARMIYTPDERNSIWTAVSHAERSPARFNHDGKIVLSAFPLPDGSTGISSLYGDHPYRSEKLLAYELGYRSQLLHSLSVDIAGFYNDYTDLESAEPLTPPRSVELGGVPLTEFPLEVENRLDGKTIGGELTFELRPIERWRLVASYSYIDIDLRHVKGSQDIIFMGGEHQSPEHQYLVRSLLNLPYNFEFDATWRKISSILTFDVGGYSELDLRLGWHASKKLEFSLVGQNLLSPSHLEFSSNLVDTARTKIERGVLGKVTYRY